MCVCGGGGWGRQKGEEWKGVATPNMREVDILIEQSSSRHQRCSISLIMFTLE